ncbi:MAG: nucleotidyltransferase family protein [Gemmatimonadota bacterium]
MQPKRRVLRYHERAMGGVLEAIDRDGLAELCRRHGITRLALFGSAVRGDLAPDSDLDVLVEFVPGKRFGLRFITVQEELRALLGRKVDLNTLAFLSPYFRDRVEAEAVPVYEAA